MFSSGQNMGRQLTCCTSGHLNGSPKPGTVQLICLRVAMDRDGVDRVGMDGGESDEAMRVSLA